MWKQTIAIFLSLTMLLTVLPGAQATENEPASADVTVSIVDAGEIVVAAESLTVTDCDKDGNLTVNDALIAAHEQFYEGGAEAGYASAESVYGMSVLKLWGKDHGGFGYCVNHVSAMSPLDAVAEGDSVTAYTYSDLTNWSDVYTYFDADSVKVYNSQAFDVTLYELGYDADWTQVTKPLAGAVITLNGKETSFVTDEEGKATVSVTGGCVLSAKTDDGRTLVPPVMKVTVTSAGEKARVTKFSDVSENAWYYKVVMEAAQMGLLKGKNTEKGLYDPDANLTVAEFLTIMYRFGEKIGQYSGKATTGVKWKEAASFMQSELNMSGWNLDKAITRAEMASATTGYLLELTEYTGRSIYVDTSLSKELSDISDCLYKASIQFLQKAGVVNGYPDGTFKPNQNISRSEAAQIIYNLNHELSLSD